MSSLLELRKSDLSLPRTPPSPFGCPPHRPTDTKLKDIPSISVQEEVGVMYDNGSVRISKNQGLIPRAGNVVFLKCSGAEVPKCVWVDQTGQIVKKTTIWFNRRYFNNDDAVIKL
jgi:hypothetical protein